MSSSFFCKDCGFETNVWSGKCPSCEAWSSFAETTRITGKKSKDKEKSLFSDKIELIPLSQVKIGQNIREKTGINEFDTVLGGGIVSGMSALIGGEPGIGKSTIMLQIASKIASKGKKILYASGEESSEQIHLRSKRLNILSDDILLYCSNDAEAIFNQIKNINPDIVIIDSIQSVYLANLDNFPGSITQIRECATLFTQIAKKMNIPIFMIGHINKDGMIAGPKILEHIVDTVMYFEGELSNQFKMLRTTKNRFGSTNEIGLFEMTDAGLREVANPSELFIEHSKSFPGTAISCVIEGSRAFLIEVQALVSPTTYGNAQRVSVGFDQKRLSLLLAVIEKHIGFSMKEYDVFINFSGGMKIHDTSADLAIITTILSSLRDMIIPEKTIFIGEVGLNGDIRNVSQLEKRLKEAVKLGYQNVYFPENNSVVLKNDKNKKYIQHFKVSSVKEMIGAMI
ncbi:MAG: DNA repair protein RadA [Candidatus Cloacimonetes bacterium]|nr:DNA repair protein RadA [Candidatus Cloacimonadota bacterium]